MTPVSLLADLRARGVSVRADGADLVATPRASLTDADRVALREHKAQLLAHLWIPAEVRAEWAEHGWCVVDSELLGERVVFVPDEGAHIPKHLAGLVVYHESELLALRDAKREALVNLHLVKGTFDGTILGRAEVAA
ncbi:MAG TPA: hypothetical protein PLG21_17930 [Anaerolineae bacterium]|nr:hypothetical protein [Anaerolineae bacterium]